MIHFLVKAATTDLAEVEKLKADEMIRNAIEYDLQFDDGTTLNIVTETDFINLDDTRIQGALGVELVSKRFTAGAM
jgi:hypothetical protein